MINPKTKTKTKARVKKPTAKPHRQTRQTRQEPSLAQKFSLYLIVATVVVVIFALLINIFFSSSQIVENRLHYLAKVYYEDYYYDNLTANGNTDTLAQYSEQGLPSVKLSQLLTFNNHQYANFKTYFMNDRYTCSVTGTSVRYYPVAPYSPQDYTVQYNYDCSHMAQE